MIKFLSILAGIIIFCLAALLVFENRDDPKIWSKALIPILVGLIGIIVTILFQSKPTPIQEKYHHFHIYNFTDGKPLFLDPIEKTLSHQGGFWEIYYRINKSKTNNISYYGDKEIIYIKFLETYGDIFVDTWNQEIKIDNSFLESRQLEFIRHEGNLKSILVRNITYADSSNIIKKYFDEKKDKIDILKLPEDTEVSYSDKSGLNFKNKYFNVNIRIEQLHEFSKRDKGQMMGSIYDSIDREGFKSDYENKKFNTRFSK